MDIVKLGMSIDTQDVDKAKVKTKQYATEVQKTGQTLKSTLSQMAKNWKVVTAAVGAAVLVFRQLGNVIRVLRDFENSMSQVAAISRATTTELAAMRDMAKDLGSTTEFTAAQAADGMRFLAMAGFSASDSITAITDVLDLATASGMGLANAADIASNVMSAFSVKAEDASDVTDALAAVASRANTSVQQLGDAMKFVGPVASAMGLNVNETAAAMGVLSDNGLQGSMAGTGLRRVLSSLVNPTNEAADALASMGVSLESVNPVTNDLTDIVDRLADSGLSAADALTIFGDRGGPAILALVNSKDRLRSLTDEMRNVEGAASDMAATMRDNLNGDVMSMVSAFQGLAIAIGDAGVTSVLRGLIQVITLTTRGITAMVEALGKLPAAVGHLLGMGKAQREMAEASNQVTMAMNEEIAKSDVLTGSLTSGRTMSVDTARVKLVQAEAHLAVVDAMREEALELVRQSSAYQDLQQDILYAREEILSLQAAAEASPNSSLVTLDLQEAIARLQNLVALQQEMEGEVSDTSEEYKRGQANIELLKNAIENATGETVTLGERTENAAVLAERLANAAAGVNFDAATASAARLAGQLGISLEMAQRMQALGPQNAEGSAGRGRGGDPREMGGSFLDYNTQEADEFLANYKAPSVGGFSGGGGGGGGGESEAQKTRNSLMEEGKRLTESLWTAQEKYNAAMLKNNELLRAGAIDTETFKASQLQLDQQMAEAKWGEVIGGVETLSNGLISAARNGDNLGEALVTMLANMAQQWLVAAITAKAADTLSGGILGASMGAGGGAMGSLASMFIPGHANGTYNSEGGLAMVGERGRELVKLPKGSQVIPNDRIGGHMKNAAPKVDVNQKFVNVLDPGLVGDYMNTVEGEELIMNIVSRNQR